MKLVTRIIEKEATNAYLRPLFTLSFNPRVYPSIQRFDRRNFVLFAIETHLIGWTPSSYVSMPASYSHFGDAYASLALAGSLHLTRYLAGNGSTGCPAIKRDRIHCVLDEGATPLRGDSFDEALAGRMSPTWPSLRFPCAAIVCLFLPFRPRPSFAVRALITC